MFHRTVRALTAIAFIASVAGTGLSVLAASTAKDSKPRSPTSVRFIDAPSSESPAARRARLKKECKGRPNAGACLGMTRN